MRIAARAPWSVHDPLCLIPDRRPDVAAPAFAETEFATPEAVEKIAEARTFESDLGAMPYRLIKFGRDSTRRRSIRYSSRCTARGRGNDNLKTIHHSPCGAARGCLGGGAGKFPCFIVVPQCPDNSAGWTRTGTPEPMRWRTRRRRRR
ncbi:MAG: hypothetical protein R3F11_14040 [Verrucomicrobiales bacterium]